MFDGLQDKLQGVFRRLKGEGRVSEEVLKAALREIRLALLEADVHFRVVKPFVARVSERALGSDVLESLTPAQQVIKIVKDELVTLLGDDGAELELTRRPAVVLLCGLQGSGKTTTAGKLALRLRNRGRRPLLVAGDLQRAAAVDQLRQVGAAVEVEVLTPADGEGVVALARRALKEAKTRLFDTVIFDTAGRLHVDEQLMEELQAVAGVLDPEETLFVADSMTGQDAVKSAAGVRRRRCRSHRGHPDQGRRRRPRWCGALDPDGRRTFPIRFVGVGEKAEDLQLFSPRADRLADPRDGRRPLADREGGGGARRRRDRSASPTGWRGSQFNAGRPPRPAPSDSSKPRTALVRCMEMLPKAGPVPRPQDATSSQDEDRRLKSRIEAIMNSMTRQGAAQQPKVLNASRKRRIARGSGTSGAGRSISS